MKEAAARRRALGEQDEGDLPEVETTGNTILTPEEFEKYGRFNHSLKRVQNRSKGEPTVTNINTLPDINLEGVDVENILKLTGYITVDGMIS